MKNGNNRWFVALLVAAMLVLMPSMAVANTQQPTTQQDSAQQTHQMFSSDVKTVFHVEKKISDTKHAHTLICNVMIVSMWVIALTGGDGKTASSWTWLVCQTDNSGG